MKFKTLSAVMLLTLVFVGGVSFTSTAEARCHPSFGFSVGNSYASPRCERVVVQRPYYYQQPVQPVYIPAPGYYAYPAPVQPVYEEVYVYPSRPNYYSNFSFGWNFR